MEFKILFKTLKARLSDGMDIPQFFRDLIAMITDVSEEEWGTGKDPSNRALLDETYRSYAKRKLPKKFAQSIVYRLDTGNLVDFINEKPKELRVMLADDLITYDVEINESNVAARIGAYMTKIVQAWAGLAPAAELADIQQKEAAIELKQKYGEYLLLEADKSCPSCGNLLYVTKGSSVQPVYEVAVIDPAKSVAVDNLLAMCPTCKAMHDLDGSKKRINEMKAAKGILYARRQSEAMLDDMALEKGIAGVVSKIKDLKEDDLADASLDPKEIKQKLDPKKDVGIYGMVNYLVTTYYPKVREIMINLDKRNVIDYEEVQDQMKAIYRKLKKTKKNKMEIFYEIAKKIHKISLQEDLYCQIVVAYFIQSCEVFEENVTAK